MDQLGISNLDLSHNKIEVISNLGRMPSLENLDLSSNRIVGGVFLRISGRLDYSTLISKSTPRVVGGLEPCTVLREVNLSNNAIVDVEEYFWLKNLRYLKRLDARGNAPEESSKGDRIL